MRFKLCASAFLPAILLLLALPQPLRADEWLPVPPEDLALKDNPKEPGAHAMILYREVEQDDQRCAMTEYVRVKIFDEAGRDYADAETEPYETDVEQVADVKGRTIHPDGSIVPFEGKVYQKKYLKYRSIGLSIATFTLPDVTPGSILEYRYKIVWDKDAELWYADHWMIGARLFEKKAHFSYVPYQDSDLQVYWQNFLIDQKPVEQMAGGSAGTGPSQRKKMVMDVENIEGVEEETYMPPILEMRPRIEFFYALERLPSADEYWRQKAKELAGFFESYMDRRGAMEAQLGSIANHQDSHDVKLQKIYDYVRSLRNLTYDPRLSIKEIIKMPKNNNVEDIVKHGYGTDIQLNLLFVALARAAGVEAYPVAVAGRDELVFHKEILKMKQLTSLVALVRDGGKEQYFDPAMPMCPFGTLPWEFTAVTGLRLDKKAPAFITTPTPVPANAALSRQGDFKLDADGNLEGTVTVKFTGEEALLARFAARNQDDAGKKKVMEDMVKDWLVHRAEVTLDSVNDWNSSTLPLIASFTIRVPGYASSGSRMVFAPMIFAGHSRNPFAHSERSYPIYFEYPFVRSDDITISLPAGGALEGTPAPKNFGNSMADYSYACTTENGNVHLDRQFRLNGVFVDKKYYSAVRNYFGRIQDSDNENAVLQKN